MKKYVGIFISLGFTFGCTITTSTYNGQVYSRDRNLLSLYHDVLSNGFYKPSDSIWTESGIRLCTKVNKQIHFRRKKYLLKSANGSYGFAPEWATHFITGNDTHVFMRLDDKDRLLSLGLVWKVADEVYAGGRQVPSASPIYSANLDKAFRKRLRINSTKCNEDETK